MADPVVSVEPTHVVVEPGGQVPVTVTVRNAGQLVEGFRLTVHGVAADWAEVLATGETEPGQRDVVRVYPGKEGTATVVFAAPPVSAGLTGEVPFCVLAQSVVDPGSSAAAEGDLEVGRVDGLAASITPVTSTGRWSGRHTVKVSNWGNAPASLRLTASDPDEALGFLVHPEHLRLPVGASAVAAVRVRSRRPFLRGSPVRLPFRVVAEPDVAPGSPGRGTTAPGPPLPPPAVSDARRPVLDGALNQRPVLSTGMVALAALAVLGLAAAVVVLLTADPAPATERPVDTTAPVPQGLRPTAESDTEIRLNWDPLPRKVDGYQLFRVRPGTQEQLIPVTPEEITVSGDRTEYTFEELEPATESCFQIAAVRGESRSPRSTAVCKTTQETPAEAAPTSSAPASENAPAPPPADPGTSTPATSTPGTSSGSGTTSTDAGTSTPAPDTTGSGGSTAGATPATTPATTEPPDFGDDWVLARPIPAGPAADQAVQRREEQLRSALETSGRTGLEIGILDSGHYPGLGFTRASVVVVVGRFPSREEAAAACPDLGFDPSACQPRQPGQPRQPE